MQKLRNIQVLEKEKEVRVSRLKNLEDNTPLAQLPAEEDNLQREIFSLDDKIQISKHDVTLPLTSGPTASNLDSVLQEHGIYMQAYHGRSFVGNHCHKYFQYNVYSTLCHSIENSASTLCDATHIADMSEAICQKFLTLNSLYSKVHTSVSHGKTMDENAIQEARKCIDHYMEFYRDTFPNKVIPKMHFLEDHVVPWMQRWKCGMAFHGEQAVESLHAEFNKLQRAACGIKNKTSQLLSMMKSHHLKCSPLIHTYIIPAKKRRV